MSYVYVYEAILELTIPEKVLAVVVIVVVLAVIIKITYSIGKWVGEKRECAYWQGELDNYKSKIKKNASQLNNDL